MEDEAKVFHSEISRVDCSEENNLYDLIKIIPAVPVPQQPDCTNETWEFTPNYDKHYIPRKGSKLKVKTVSEIRAVFEKDIYTYLPNDLEKQQHYLLRKIRDGSSCEEKTRESAINLLNADNPISRSAWLMLANINPEKHKHPKQFVLWNAKCIQVNGSRGGKTKFICNYDLKNFKKSPLTSTNLKKNFKPRIGLLRNSLNVNFKPGPLGKKKFLDASHHKYQMGDIELIKLPTPALEITTAYGTVLEPVIANMINGLRGEKGFITQKFAEFATSALGKLENNIPAQLDKKSVSFDLNYKCDQNRLLMRRNVVGATSYTNDGNHADATVNSKNKSIALHSDIRNDCNQNKTDNESILEIQKVMDEMLNSIEISLKQDSMFSTENELREPVADDSKDIDAIKDKPKRRYGELDKLDVTVIKLPESSQKHYNKPCGKSFCTLGCICASIDSAFSLKQHCGVFDCMFGCKCEVSVYKNIELLERDCSDIIPGLLNLDNEINSHLTKEEQKFHQTVIVSGEKRILLKSRKRNWKSSKKYAEFYSKMNLKNDEKIKKILTIDVTRLNCENIEPLCMVHNLYKCFCKCKFTQSYVPSLTDINGSKILNDEHTKMVKETDKDSGIKGAIKTRLRGTCGRTKSASASELVALSSIYDDNDESNSCARTMGYNGRKYTDGYYLNTNRKIIEMEKNDDLLRSKMLRLMNGGNDDVLLLSDTPDSSSESYKNDGVSNKTLNNSRENNNVNVSETENKSSELCYPFRNSSNKRIFRDWLEASYKSYKERLGLGLVKQSLEAPKNEKAALHTWDFILTRYRDRKNHFFVSKEEPFRTFLAVDDQHPFLASCIKIDDIRFAELSKYPLIVRNLVTNASDSEKSFCILRGWDHCWELFGCAVKLIECVKQQSPSKSQEDTDTEMLLDQKDIDTNDCFDQNMLFNPESISLSDDKDCSQTEKEIQSERSKWFVMTVENDFTEIQFNIRGFFVSYDGIQRSISLARISGKTVRLSSHARTDKCGTPSFGIYAIPHNSESCVFIGPYEINEPLGMEVVKSVFGPTEHRKTRGVWLTTNKVDNTKVIDQPLSYLSSVSNVNTVTYVDPTCIDTNTLQSETSRNDEQGKILPNIEIPKELSKDTTTKIVKPIKIRRTNGFYHLSKKVINKMPQSNNSLIIKKTLPINKDSIILKNPISLLKKAENLQEFIRSSAMTNWKPVGEVAPQINTSEESVPNSSVAYIKPVAEIAPQIKIASVYSERDLEDKTVTLCEKKPCGNMLILKPEEINKKILAQTNNTAQNVEMGTDIEKFLETSCVCLAPEEVLVISDGEEDDIRWKDVWIQCLNVGNFGWIRGRVNDDQLLSFEFPGFKYSDFYAENEAFEKINQVLARKIYIPKSFKLLWHVTEDEEYVTCDKLTSTCLEDKGYLLIRLREQREKKRKLGTTASSSTIKRNKMATRASSSADPVHLSETSTESNETVELLDNLEETSKELDKESVSLWNEAVMKRNELIGSLSLPEKVKEGMTETLQAIMSMNEQ